VAWFVCVAFMSDMDKASSVVDGECCAGIGRVDGITAVFGMRVDGSGR